MKYIIGYTSYEYLIEDIRIPKKSTERSDADVTTVDDTQLKKLQGNATFKALVDSKSINVLDTKPSWAVSAAEQIQEKDQALAEEKAKNAALEAELAKLKAAK